NVRHGGVRVEPGLAIDQLGRELVVPQPLLIRVETLRDLLDEGEATKAGVVAVFDVLICHRTRLPSQPVDCDGRAFPGRASEETWLRIERVAAEALGVNSKRKTATARPEPEPPRELAGLDDSREWPVYVCSIHATFLGTTKTGANDAADAPSGKQAWVLTSMSLSDARRKHAKLKGGHVAPPWDRSAPWMTLSSPETGARRRFAVTLHDALGTPIDRVRLDAAGNAELRGPLWLRRAFGTALSGDGHLTLTCATDESAERRRDAGLTLAGRVALPEAAKPWHAYRTREQDSAPEELRFETENPGEEGDPARQQWAVGTWGTNAAEPVLTVRADGLSVIVGDLHVNGQLTEGPIPADMDNPRFRDELLSRWTKGLTAGGGEVDAYYRPSARVETAESGDVIDVDVSVSNDQDRPVVIRSIELEVRNHSNEIIHVSRIAGAALPLPVPGGESRTLEGSFGRPSVGVYNLLVKIKTLGGAQALLEQTVTKLLIVE
ncbi:MAG TPA: hypothetical protein VF989_09300, partial [Polyangiaceae bacterium]